MKSRILVVDDESRMRKLVRDFLMRKEFEVLELLVTKPNKVYSREKLLNLVWGTDYPGDVRTVDSQIKRLRAKLDQFEHPGWRIKTVWGIGYRFETLTRIKAPVE